MKTRLLIWALISSVFAQTHLGFPAEELNIYKTVQKPSSILWAIMTGFLSYGYVTLEFINIGKTEEDIIKNLGQPLRREAETEGMLYPYKAIIYDGLRVEFPTDYDYERKTFDSFTISKTKDPERVYTLSDKFKIKVGGKIPVDLLQNHSYKSFMFQGKKTYSWTIVTPTSLWESSLHIYVDNKANITEMSLLLN
jgi:hypothetical protein